MADFPVFDGHNDILLKYLRGDGSYNFFGDDNESHIDFKRGQAGGFAGGFFATFVPNPRDPDAAPLDFDQFKTDDGFSVPLPDPITYEHATRTVMSMAKHLFRIEQQSDGKFKVVRNADELEQCINDGVMAAIFHFEGAEAISESLNELELYYQAGLRSIGLVWSRGTIFAEGVPFKFPSSPDTGPGLTDAGKALVKACNEMGILVDLSHINEKGFWDVAEISDAPLVATHSNVHALCPVTRNLTDKQLEAIKASDGMVGLNFAVGFLRKDGTNDANTPLAVMVEHIDYLVEAVGIDRVGFGSDFDGATMPAELKDVAGLPKLIQALRDAGYNDEALNKITHQNWLRVLRKTWK